MKPYKENYRQISLIVGFLVWLCATILFRLAGQYFFIVGNAGILVVLYLILIPVLGLISIAVFNSCKLNRSESIGSATLMVLPGMLLDSFCVQFFEDIFPNMPTTDSKTFGAWLMFAYAIVLIFGLLRKKDYDDQNIGDSN
jgi:hypothetical protein